ncbi:MAG: hypothetical protein JW793_02960 [Acidobacteria bacterium]|nr:hypothetical protein [Acidobacteriota bacterium]
MARYLPILLIAVLAALLIPSAHLSSAGKLENPSDAGGALPDILNAVAGIRGHPSVSARYDYVVTAGVRILLFWYSRDDVGEGYIRVGHAAGDENAEFIQLVMGSDPAKAPRGINRWGAAMETFHGRTRTGYFFGFMKKSGGNNVSEMEGELEREKSDREFYFESIVSRATESGMHSVTVPIHSSLDLSLHQLPEAENMVHQRMSATRNPSRFLDKNSMDSCGHTHGMLFTLREMSLSLLDREEAPEERCYAYNSKPYLLSLRKFKPVDERLVSFRRKDSAEKTEAAYRNLISADFLIRSAENGDETKFSMLIGSEGKLRGVPVQIRYQPNWWFRVVLNLDPENIQSEFQEERQPLPE